MRVEKSREKYAPDTIIGEKYEKDDHFWQNVIQHWKITYYDSTNQVSSRYIGRWLRLFLLKGMGESSGEKVVYEDVNTTIDLGPKDPPNNCPIISKSNYQFWYGCVNCWSQKVNGHYPFEAQIEPLRGINCTGYHIEFVGWKGGQNADLSMANQKDAYGKLVKLCRDNKMWIFVDLINGNWNGSSTRWTKGVSIDYSRFTMDYIVKNYGQTIINIIKEQGPQNVLIQPIGEPGSKGQADACHRFQDMCIDQLGPLGFQFATEPKRNNSSKMSKAMKYSVKHVTNDCKQISEDTALIRGKNDGAGSWEDPDGCQIAVTDSGPAIQALASCEQGSKQGWLDKWPSAGARSSRLTSAVRTYKGRVAVFCYYAFKFKCLGTNGSTVDSGLAKHKWDSIKEAVNPKYP